MPTVDGLPYPNSSATPDVPGDMLLLVNALARKAGSGVARAADATGLAQLVTDGLVTDGMLAQQTDTKAISQRRSSSWLPPVISTYRQLDTTNDIVGTITVGGIGKIIGNGTGRITESVTFGTTFVGTPVVVASYIGFRATGASNPAGLTASVTIMPFAAVSNQSTTGFDVTISQGGTLAAANDWYYSWIAIGVPA